MKNRIVCAAMMLESGLIVCGARHFDKLMKAQMKATGQTFTEAPEQGFVDRHGSFHNRVEAAKIAVEAGQLFRPMNEGQVELFSENLY